MKQVTWLDDVNESNYPAAESYLSLIYDEGRVAELIAALRQAPLTQFRAKDVFRASQLSILGVSNARVEHDREKIRQKIGLSPLLLVRDTAHGKVVIADGYHRMCALYGFDEDCWVRCKIV
jgi:hypothetical protein